MVPTNPETAARRAGDPGDGRRGRVRHQDPARPNSPRRSTSPSRATTRRTWSAGAAAPTPTATSTISSRARRRRRSTRRITATRTSTPRSTPPAPPATRPPGSRNTRSSPSTCLKDRPIIYLWHPKWLYAATTKAHRLHPLSRRPDPPAGGEDAVGPGRPSWYRWQLAEGAMHEAIVNDPVVRQLRARSTRFTGSGSSGWCCSAQGLAATPTKDSDYDVAVFVHGLERPLARAGPTRRSPARMLSATGMFLDAKPLSRRWLIRIGRR